jgi:large subunit ribosomal protein L24
MKIKKGDNVIVTIGKDKAKKGKVEKIFSKEKKALVLGLNLFKRHKKGNTAGQRSEIITLTKPINISNLALVCPNCNKQTRIGYLVEKESKKRICLKCKKVI